MNAMLDAVPMPGPSTLRAAFRSALPARDWNDQASQPVFVGLFELAHWHSWVADAYSLLDAVECQRVAHRRSEAQRDELALAYALHRLLLSQVLGCEATRVPIRRDAAGCPRLSGRTLATSLSHTDGCVALAVCASGPVGVDIEPAARAAVMSEIAERVCHPDDAEATTRLVGDARNAALLALWVRKEAFLKAAGIGLQQEMQSFPAPDGALLPLPGVGASRVRMLDVGPHWVAAAAGPPDVAVQFAWLRPEGSGQLDRAAFDLRQAQRANCNGRRATI